MSGHHIPPADLAALPKAELHVHLEGSVRPATLEEFASRSGVRIPRTFTSLDTFVEMYMLAWRTMTEPGDYARLVREYCEDAVRCGVRYAEIQMPTIGRTYNNLGEALDEGAKQRDITVRFMIDVPRSLPVEVGWAMLEAAKGAAEVVAIGLGGPESTFPPEPFGELFMEAKRRGLRSAPHAGEDAGVASVRAALDVLGAERIQHGVRSVEDAALVRELAERGVALAACPTSNVLLGVVSAIEAHPLRELWDAGVLVSVNTDDPGFFDCDLVGEYAIAGRLLGLDRAGYARLARNGVESSFAPEDVRAQLRSEVDDWETRVS
jgi:adenosine deaminase